MFPGNSGQRFGMTAAELDFWRALLGDAKASTRHIFSWAKLTFLRDFKAGGFLEEEKGFLRGFVSSGGVKILESRCSSQMFLQGSCSPGFLKVRTGLLQREEERAEKEARPQGGCLKRVFGRNREEGLWVDVFT